MKKLVFMFLLLFFITGYSAPTTNVKTGADILVEKHLDMLAGKNIGIVTNHTAVLNNGTHIVDTLFTINNVNVKVLFGPEHGIRGDAPDGLKIKDGTDAKTGLPVYSLYGKIRKPTPEMLEGVDVLIFDIQDIGARFYTFISTMYYTLEAAAENNIKVLVLDRPNPINGIYVDGPIRVDSLKSFVAIAPVPVVHGMTVGELATIFNEEKMLKDGVKADLQVIKAENWQREMYFDDCNLTWINPSPNIPDLETAIIYPGTCLIEGTNISEGRGTYSPFKQIGAPFINGEELASAMNEFNLPGIEIKPVEYTPVSIEKMSTSPKYKDEKCYGISIKVTDRDKFESFRFGVYLVSTLHKLYPDNFEFRRKWLDNLSGVSWIREEILNNESPAELISKWEKEVDNFKILREKYLLY